MIGVALKSQKAATYIDQIMGLEEENQEFLGAIVEDCLASIEDARNTSANVSVTSKTQDDEDEEKNASSPMQLKEISMSSYSSVD